VGVLAPVKTGSSNSASQPNPSCWRYNQPGIGRESPSTGETACLAAAYPESSPPADDSRRTDRRDDGRIATRSRKEVSVTRHTYEIRVIGSFGPDARAAFADTMVQVEPTITVLSGEFDQRGLHTLLDRVRAVGLELVDVRQVPPSA
jgi:hypothetical protein